MSHVVSLIGPPTVGKTAFAKWFVRRNPIYVHIDVAEYRKWYGTTKQGISNAERIHSEKQVWASIERTICQAGCAIIESTGLSDRLYDVLDTADSSCSIKLLAEAQDLSARIIKRNNHNSDLELMYLEQDLFEIKRIPADLIGENISLLQYPQLEAQIFLFMLERMNMNSTLTSTGDSDDSPR